MRACADDFLATLSEGVVLGVNKVVTQLSFGVTQQHKVSGGNGHFATISQCHIQTLDGS